MYGEKDAWGNTTDYYGNKRGFDGSFVGVGAPSGTDQSMAGVGPFDTPSTAADKVRRFHEAQGMALGTSTTSASSARSNGGLGFLNILFLLFGLALIVGLVGVWGYWKVESAQLATSVVKRAKLINFAINGDFAPLDFAGWEEFAASAPKGAPLGLDPKQLAAQVNENAFAPGSATPSRVARRTLLQAAAWHCVASRSQGNCLSAAQGAPIRYNKSAGSLPGLSDAAIGFLRSENVRSADADLAASQEAALCIRTLHLSPGKPLEKCVAGLDAQIRQFQNSPRSLVLQSYLSGWRWRLAAVALG